MEKKIRVIRKEGEMTVLELEDGQMLRWGTSALPTDIAPGASVRIVTAAQTTSELAATVLSELLKPKPVPTLRSGSRLECRDSQ